MLKGGQLVYINRPGVEVDGNSFDVMEQFLGTVEDVRVQTNGYRDSSILNQAVALAMVEHERMSNDASSVSSSSSSSSASSSLVGSGKRKRPATED